MRIFCDFDGTISSQDATDFILSRFADPEWRQIEDKWLGGDIGSAQCMRKQIALIRASLQQLDAALDEIEIDPTFPNFVNFCRTRKLSPCVISDGVDYFIQRILGRHRLPPLRVIANRLVMETDGGQASYQLATPHAHGPCASGAGVCKCRFVCHRSDICVYIGDGRSDFCVANLPDLVFAKGALAEFCAQQDITFIPFQRFSDVTAALSRTLPSFPAPSQYSWARASA